MSRTSSEKIFDGIASTLHCDPENPPCSPSRSGKEEKSQKGGTMDDFDDHQEQLSTVPLGPSYDQARDLALINGDSEVSSRRECSTADATKGDSSSIQAVKNSRGITDVPKNNGGNQVHGEDNVEDIVPEQVRIKVPPGGNGDNRKNGAQRTGPKHRAVTKIPASSPMNNHEEKGDHGGDEEAPRCCCASPRKDGARALAKNHTSYFPFGKGRTLFPITMSIVGIICSILCKESTNFVTLEKPIYVDAQHDTVTELGLFWMELCRTDEFINYEASVLTERPDLEYKETIIIDSGSYETSGSFTRTQVEYEGLDTDDLSFFYGGSMIINEHTESSVTEEADLGQIDSSPSSIKDCRKFKLDSNIVHDGLWNTARILVGFTTGIGFLFSVALISTSFWNSANLVAIAFGIFVTYLCQCFAFLFYDSTICRKYVCYSSTGTTIAAAASFCWFLAGVGTLCMYMYDRNQKHTQEMKNLKEQIVEKKRKKQRETFIATQWSIFDLFRPGSGNDTDPPSSSDEEASKASL
mmetsp:Transcript_16256/g.20590  ORF Transcript_16256/g.20590 Transcript_16256/m.20590 type:complete len:524 (-) Transcript_16256:2040-3611(-)